MSNSRTAPTSGNHLIDGQHGHLTELINHAAAALRDGRGDFNAAILAFHRALEHHFAVEGVIFRGAGFGASQEHDDAHAVILDRIRTIADSLADLGGASDRHGVIDEMERILFDHELLEDSGYWESVRDDASRLTATWDSSLETGIDWIDDQHRHLMVLINQMVALGPSGDKAAVTEAMDHFRRHVSQHFAAEERYLQTQGLGVSTHRSDHIRLMEELEDLTTGINSATLAVNYLRFWILDHIRTTDLPDFGKR
ncbi:hypothetical protein CU669_02525 [Paramagnetospirillum kuznetsovii]|uniref:Hemerythrin-like domain-containing protein n=1 Tax=Paramagnetospirillum kuznetsovii TaxID=2053833 RepID=A0A364P3R0_9PROT|nr:hemerythrin domain-containing protein [Paramagnetospirillum kuznetsovii]RAU23963.1 hypothetical protein CU669_02525 [Paramagnetospirillum kuznetsovii]